MKMNKTCNLGNIILVITLGKETFHFITTWHLVPQEYVNFKGHIEFTLGKIRKYTFIKNKIIKTRYFSKIMDKSLRDII